MSLNTFTHPEVIGIIDKKTEMPRKILISFKSTCPYKFQVEGLEREGS